jgi:hypothetical protein
LASIWFPESLAEADGFVRGSPFLKMLPGWIGLLMPLLVRLVYPYESGR